MKAGTNLVTFSNYFNTQGAKYESFPFWEVIQMKAGTNLVTFSNYFNTQGAKSTYQLDANFLIGLNTSPYSWLCTTPQNVVGMEAGDAFCYQRPSKLLN